MTPRSPRTDLPVLRWRSRWLDWRYGPSIDPTAHNTCKFFPRNPPRKGEKVLIDRRRCEVTRAKVSWDGPRWTLHDLRVKPVEPPETTL